MLLTLSFAQVEDNRTNAIYMSRKMAQTHIFGLKMVRVVLLTKVIRVKTALRKS